jgi:prolyl oligopeptidase PreP (S9A serine peptidase family)
MQYKHFIIFFLLFIIACNGSQQNQVVEQKLENKTYRATDFISNGDIVWCQKNYEFLMDLYNNTDYEDIDNFTVQEMLEVKIIAQAFADTKAFGGNNEDSERTIELKEFEEKLDYLQRSVDLLIPHYNELDHIDLLSLHTQLGMRVTVNLNNKPNWESRFGILETNASVCSTWKESVNS